MVVVKYVMAAPELVPTIIRNAPLATLSEPALDANHAELVGSPWYVRLPAVGQFVWLR